MLTLIDLVGLLPLLIVASTAVLVMLGVAWRRHHGGTAAVTVSGVVGRHRWQRWQAVLSPTPHLH